MKEDDPRLALIRREYDGVLDQIEVEPTELSDTAVEALAADVVNLLASRLGSAGRHAHGNAPEPAFQSFVQALVQGDPERARDLVDEARAGGTSLDTIYLEYLARAAQHLGELWDQDRLDFLQVSVAIGRIFTVMRGLRQVISRPREDPRRHALFISMPGDDHVLGAAIATDLFRARGWHIQLEAPFSVDDAVAALVCSRHSVVGVSASRVEQLVDLANMVLAFRFCRPEVFVIVSGPLAETTPHLLDLVDADDVARTALDAIELLEERVMNRLRAAARR